jgi:hypothetical protein
MRPSAGVGLQGRQVLERNHESPHPVMLDQPEWLADTAGGHYPLRFVCLHGEFSEIRPGADAKKTTLMTRLPQTTTIGERLRR